MSGYSIEGVNRKRISIGCASNRLYFPGLAVALSSLLRHHKGDWGFDIYIFESHVIDSWKDRLRRMVKQYRFDVQITYINFDSERFSSLPKVRYITKETYARLLLPELLSTTDKVLYIDCDLLIMSDVADLWSIDISAFSSAMCRDALLYVRDSIPTTYFELGLEPEALACNAGLMLLNLRYWRANRISDRVSAYLERHAETLRAADQDGINAVLAGTWLELSPLWNVMVATFMNKKRWSRQTEAFYHPFLAEMENSPMGVHFTGPKPWIDGKPSRWNKYFWKEAEKSGWYSNSSINFERMRCLGRFLFRVFKRSIVRSFRSS
jgi:lipopolysaccharide biosynthesis glycosyltransferase